MSVTIVNHILKLIFMFKNYIHTHTQNVISPRHKKWLRCAPFTELSSYEAPKN